MEDEQKPESQLPAFIFSFYIGRELHAFFHVGRGCLGAQPRFLLCAGSVRRAGRENCSLARWERVGEGGFSIPSPAGGGFGWGGARRGILGLVFFGGGGLDRRERVRKGPIMVYGA